jgi:hypothetical protein
MVGLSRSEKDKPGQSVEVHVSPPDSSIPTVFPPNPTQFVAEQGRKAIAGK